MVEEGFTYSTKIVLRILREIPGYSPTSDFSDQIVYIVELSFHSHFDIRALQVHIEPAGKVDLRLFQRRVQVRIVIVLGFNGEIVHAARGSPSELLFEFNHGFPQKIPMRVERRADLFGGGADPRILDSDIPLHERIEKIKM